MDKPKPFCKDDEPILVSAAKAGDSKAIGILFEHYAPILENCVPPLRSFEDRRDLVQLVLNKALRAIEKYDPDRSEGNLLRWLMGILRHAVADYWADPQICLQQDLSAGSDNEDGRDLISEIIDVGQPLPTVVALSSEAWRELISMAFQRDTPPHMDLSYGFSSFLEWKPTEFDEPCVPWARMDEEGNKIPPPIWEPREIGEKLSDFKLARLFEAFFDGYQRLSGIPQLELRDLLENLNRKLSLLVQETLPPNARAEYVARTGFLTEVAGLTRLSEYYTRSDGPLNIMGWSYKAQCGLFEAILEKEHGPLYEALSESHYYQSHLMRETLKEEVVKPLLGRGFEGKFPNFFRSDGSWKRCLKFEFDPTMKRFRILVAAEDADGVSRNRIAHSSIGLWHLMSTSGELLSIDRSGPAGWIYFGGDPADLNRYKGIAVSLLGKLADEDHWWPRVSLAREMEKALTDDIGSALLNLKFCGGFPKYHRKRGTTQESVEFEFDTQNSVFKILLKSRPMTRPARPAGGYSRKKLHAPVEEPTGPRSASLSPSGLTSITKDCPEQLFRFDGAENSRGQLAELAQQVRRLLPQATAWFDKSYDQKI